MPGLRGENSAGRPTKSHCHSVSRGGGAGRTAEDAAINADIIESWLDVVTDATVCGDYEPIGEADEFDMEYWSLEQAKIDKASVKPLQGQIVVVTGAGAVLARLSPRSFRY